LVEHRTPNPGAGGSNPSWPAIEQNFAQELVRIGSKKETFSLSVNWKDGLNMAAKKGERSSKNKAVAADQPASQKISPARIKEFSGEVKSEFKKIVWPDKKVTIGSTGVVLVLVFLVSVYLGAVDLFIGKLVSYILK
jgi:preprotein translocase subunit SecE